LTAARIIGATPKLEPRHQDLARSRRILRDSSIVPWVQTRRLPLPLPLPLPLSLKRLLCAVHRPSKMLCLFTSASGTHASWHRKEEITTPDGCRGYTVWMRNRGFGGNVLRRSK
jgi:hypothetical protein